MGMSLSFSYQHLPEKEIFSVSLVRPYLCVTSSWCSTYTCTYTLAFKGQPKLVCIYMLDGKLDERGKQTYQQILKIKKDDCMNGWVHDCLQVIDVNLGS